MDKETNIGREAPPGAFAGQAGGVEEMQQPPRHRTGQPAMDALQAELEETREETIQTINELERRLSFDHIKDTVKGKAHEATIGRINDMAKQTGKTSKRWGRSLIDTVKCNPLPSLMIGGGITWLVASGAARQNGNLESDYDDYEETVEQQTPHYVERRQRDGLDETGTYGMGFIDRRRIVTGQNPAADEADSDRSAQIKAKVRHRAEEARDKAAEVGDQVREKAAQAGQQVKQKAQQMGSQAAAVGHQAKRQTVRKGRQAKNGMADFMDSNPLAVAGIVMAAGAVVGAAVPTSRYEDKTLGPARDKALDRARRTGREQLHKVEAVAKETVEAAKAEAENQGLMDREKADRVEEKAKEMAKEGSDKVKARVASMGSQQRRPKS